MSKFLSRTRNDEEPPDGQDKESQEEQYKLIYPRMAEDFLDKEDFVIMMQKLMSLLDPENKFQLDWSFAGNAERKIADATEDDE